MSEPTQPTPNKKLRYERDRRCWSQQELADMIGTTPLNVSRWERGVNIPNPYFRQKLCEVFEKTAQELGLVPSEVQQSKPDEPVTIVSQPVTAPAPSSEVPAALWNVPFRRNLFFTGREDILQQLRETLVSDEHPVALTQSLAISGLGGIGKTQTAVEYAYRYRDNYTAVLWARADSHELLVSDYLTIAFLLNLSERNEQDQRKIVNAVLRWFDTHNGWLLILDNADDLDMASAFIPSSDKGHVLLTTRAYSTGTIAGRIELETMTVEEGMLFLLRRSKHVRSNAQLESVPESIRSQARAIVEEMDALPLALDQAGAYIEETGTSLADYLKLYRGRRHRLLRRRGQDAAGHPEPVATTWSLSVEKIKQANPASGELLCLLALLHPDRIPESMIVAGAGTLGSTLQPVVSDAFDFNEALGELHKYSLIKRDPQEKILVIHRLVQAVIWDGMSQSEREQWMERVIAALNAMFPEVKYEVWGECEQLLSHVLFCLAIIAPRKSNVELVSLLRKTADYLRERAQYEQAEPLYLRILSIREQAMELESPDSATVLNSLADLYKEQGRYSDAEPLYGEAIRIREQTLGSEHLDVAWSLNGLGGLYWERGKYEQAEQLYRRALHIREQTLGSEHLDVAWSLNGLALLYQERGWFEQARPLFQRALRIWEQTLGSEHPYVARPLNNLALLYWEQGKYEQAEQLYRRALHIWEQTLGPQHPDVAHPLAGLAEVYRDQGKYEQAEQLYRRALHIWEQTLGAQYPYLGYPLNGLAEICRKKREHEQAEQLYRRALHIWEQTLGSEHPYSTYPLNGLANLYCEQGKYEQAEALYQRSLTVRQQQQGAQHPETAESLHDFARFHEVRQQPDEALALYRQALAIREQQLGSQHPRTIDTRTRVARLLREMGQTEEAAALEVTPEPQVMMNDQPI